MARAKRRKFTTEFKNETVKLIRESDRSVGEICRELDLTETAVRRWLKQADVDDGKGPSGALTTNELEELRLPCLLRPWLQFPLPAAYRGTGAYSAKQTRRPARAPADAPVSEMDNRLSVGPDHPWKDKGLPGYEAILFVRAVVQHPAGLAPSLPLPLFERISGETVIAFT